jgi:hypothetical protein
MTPVWSMSEVSAALGLSPAWLTHLDRSSALPSPDGERSGVPCWWPETIRTWSRRQAVAAEVVPLSTGDLRAVTLALAGVSVRELADRTDGNPASVRGRLARTAWVLVLRTPLEVRVALLRDAGAQGRPDCPSISASCSRLVNEGPPVPGAGVTRRRLERAALLWDAGLSFDDIATALGVSKGALTRSLTSAEAPLLTERWGAPQAAVHLGWTEENVRSHRRSGTFPPPDGRTGARYWWWPRTVERFARQNLPLTCPQCGARVAQLPQHLRRHS